MPCCPTGNCCPTIDSPRSWRPTWRAVGPPGPVVESGTNSGLIPPAAGSSVAASKFDDAVKDVRGANEVVERLRLHPATRDRKSGSHATRRWREQDSHPRSRVARRGRCRGGEQGRRQTLKVAESDLKREAVICRVGRGAGRGSDFAPIALSLLRGTEGSNPAPSSRESVSLRTHFQRSKTPAFRTAVRGWLGDRVGRDAQGVSISRQLAAISRRAIFQYRSAADWVGKNAMPVPTKL
jgi:hypothetical protein